MFISQKSLEPDSIPYRVMIADELPRNANGKIDLYKISRGEVEGETFKVETVRILDRITDFKLIPHEEGSADMIKEVFDGISAEINSNLHFNRNNTNLEETEGKKMKTAKKAVDSITGMHWTGMQMMKNTISRMGQMNHAKAFENTPFSDMGDMQKIAARMKEMNKKAMHMFPDMDKMAKMHGVSRELAKSMLPVMNDQMGQMMEAMAQMNHIALDTMQKVFDQNCRMMTQVFDTAKKMNEKAAASGKEESAAPVKEEESPAFVREEETAAPAKEEPEKA